MSRRGVSGWRRGTHPREVGCADIELAVEDALGDATTSGTHHASRFRRETVGLGGEIRWTDRDFAGYALANVAESIVGCTAGRVMTLAAMLEAHRKGLLTRAELFASLTAVLAARPDDLGAVREAFAAEAALREALEDWLEELKCYPVVALGDTTIPITRQLVERLGPPNMPPLRVDPDTGVKVLTMAKVNFELAGDARPRGTFGAQIRAGADAGERYSVVIRPLADVDAGDARDVAGLIALVSPDAPPDVLRGAVELFRNGARIGVARITRLGEAGAQPRDRKVDFDFLEASP